MSELPWITKRNLFKERIQSGRPALAMWVTLPWSPLLEMLGGTGLDAAFIDLEHTTFGLEDAQDMIVAAELAGVTPIVRPTSIEPAEVGKLLDAGAHGVIFPQVNDESHAELARKCLLYPPDGVRGWGGAHTRWAMWRGASAAVALHATELEERGVYSSEYVKRTQEHLISIFIIESRRAVQRLDAILEAGRPDLVIFGWGDYSVEVGFDVRACESAASIVYETCKRHGTGVAVSLAPGDPNPYYPGCCSVVGIDTLLIKAALDSAIQSALASYRAQGLLPQD
jgi:4-hydroxy-2-oxoheptanedioate aldolase